MSELFNKIKTDNKSGSHKLTILTLQKMREFIEQSTITDKMKLANELNLIVKDIVKYQKNIVMLQKKASSVVYYLKRLAKTNKSINDIKIQTIEKIEELINEAEKKQVKIGDLGSRLIFNSNKILTISSSSLIKRILLSALKNNREFEVYCLESRPMLEGQEFAISLAKAGIPTYIVTDAMMGKILPDMNMVFTGADRLYESGFINKSGTLPLAATAAKLNVPFYIACETDKILKEIDRTIRFYSENPNEVFDKKIKKLSVLNYYFEEIPYELVSKLVCEEGVFEMHEFIKWYLKD
jgi:translation initiation factor 2B subunit (eIF-2B alpha/beta/delta family)